MPEVLLACLRPYVRSLVLAGIGGAVAQLVGIPIVLITRTVVNEAAEGEATTPRVIAALVALCLVRGAARWVQGVFGDRVGHDVVADLRHRMVESLSALSIGYFDRRRLGSTLVRFVGDAGSIRTWVSRTLIGVPVDILTVLACLVSVAVIAPPLTIPAVAPLLVVLPTAWIINARARRLTSEGRRQQARLGGEIGDLLEDLPYMRAAGVDGNLDVISGHIDGSRHAFRSRAALDGWSRAVSLAAGSLAAVSVGIVGADILSSGNAGIGDVVAVLWVSLILRGPVNRLAQANVISQRAKVAVERVEALVDRRAESEYQRGSEALPPGGPRSISSKRELVHRNRERTVEIPPFLLPAMGLVRIEGDAKGARAFFEMLLRFRRPHEGRLKVDGLDTRKIDLAALRDSMIWIDAERRSLRFYALRIHRQVLESVWDSISQLDDGRSLERTLTDDGTPSPRLLVAVLKALDRPRALLEDPLADCPASLQSALRAELRGMAEKRLILVSGHDDALPVAEAISCRVTLFGANATSLSTP